jgi:hypothetical protein
MELAHEKLVAPANAVSQAFRPDRSRADRRRARRRRNGDVGALAAADRSPRQQRTL